ncbi:AraC family transcriptional regulator [Flavivirga sp. Y03]|uniref:AraC family transcriptional regulator n=2 Tax=Flavivirga algicola TaxID=2729136 RepID=A0ABX1S3F5_9FLAO|nr:AraC family transcriptional regulator [Flavivirga algicola]
MILFLTIGQTGRFSYVEFLNGGNPTWMGIADIVIYTLPVTYFLYLKDQFNNKLKLINLLHFIPALVQGGFIVLGLLNPNENIRASFQTEDAQRLFRIFMAIGILYHLVYYVSSIILTKKFFGKITNRLSFQVENKYYVRFLTLLGLGYLFWIYYYIRGVFFNYASILDYGMFWGALSLTICFIAYSLLQNPNQFYLEETLEKYSSSKLKKADISRLKKQLELLMLEQRPYLNTKLTRKDIAKMTQISEPDVSRIVNEGFGYNFFEWVNYYRVKDFMERVESKLNSNLTLYGVAQESGFGSKSTFYKAFRDITGKTPTEYFGK